MPEFETRAMYRMTTATQVQPLNEVRGRTNTAVFYWMAGISALVLGLYVSVLGALVRNWWEDPNYGHGFLVPLFAAYVLWQERERWLSLPAKPANSGLGIIAFAIAMLIAGSLGAELFISRTSLLVMLAGLVLFLCGWKILKSIWFPLAFLVLMIPLPVLIYNQITFPLQFLSSQFAASGLDLLHVPVLREGNLLILPNYTLEVVEACSGIRSLMTLLTLAICYGYLTERRSWARIALIVLAVPIAVASNGIRIVGTGILTYFYGPGAAEGFFHAFSGWVIFVAALVLLLGAHWVLRKIRPEVVHG